MNVKQTTNNFSLFCLLAEFASDTIGLYLKNVFLASKIKIKHLKLVLVTLNETNFMFMYTYQRYQRQSHFLFLDVHFCPNPRTLMINSQ